MGSKLLVIIATGDKEKALAGLMYTRNAIRLNWLEMVKVVFFGPSEQLMVHDEEVAETVKDIAAHSAPLACKAISDREGISAEIEDLDVKVEYLGSIISNLIKDSYTPMVW